MTNGYNLSDSVWSNWVSISIELSVTKDHSIVRVNSSRDDFTTHLLYVFTLYMV